MAERTLTAVIQEANGQGASIGSGDIPSSHERERHFHKPGVKAVPLNWRQC